MTSNNVIDLDTIGSAFEKDIFPLIAMDSDNNVWNIDSIHKNAYIVKLIQRGDEAKPTHNFVVTASELADRKLTQLN